MIKKNKKEKRKGVRRKMERKRKIVVFLQRMKSNWFWFFLEERCVLPLCRRRTGVLKKTPIDKRRYYVEGVGQVCKNCANEMGIE